MKKLLNETRNRYKVEVEVSLTVLDYDGALDFDDKVVVDYDLDIEFRSWGIKGIDVFGVGSVAINYALDDNWKTLIVDLTVVDIEYVNGSNIVPTELAVDIDADGKIQKAILYVSLITPR